MSFFKKLFGVKEESEHPREKPQFPSDAHFMWEDDFVMVEFLPRENLSFLEKETERIYNFGKDHFDGLGFTAITPIGQRQVSLYDKSIDFNSVIETIEQSGLEQVNHFVYQGQKLLTGNEKPVGYGTKNFAIICDEKGGLLSYLWISMFPKTQEEKQQLEITLNALGEIHDFYLVNWYNTTYCDLTDKQSVSDFMSEYNVTNNTDYS